MTNKKFKIESSMLVCLVVILFYAIFVYAVNFGGPSPDTGEADAGSILGTFNTQTGNFTSTWTDNNIYFGIGRTGGNTARANMTLSFNISALSTNSSILITGINMSMKYCHARAVTNTCNGAGGASPQGTAAGMSVLVYNSTNWINISKINVTSTANEITIFTNISAQGKQSKYISPDGFVNLSFEFAWGGNGASSFLNDHTNLTISYDTAPIVTLLSPPTGTQSGSSSMSFNCSLTDDNGLVNVSLYTNISGNFIQNQTRAITGTSNNANFNITNIPFGAYNWNCLAVDNVNLSSFATANFTFSILDTLQPAVTIVPPTPNDGTNQTFNSIFVNATAVDSFSAIDTCRLEFNNVNETMTKVGSGTSISCFLNKTTLVDGAHSFKVFANDTRNNINVSGTRNVTIDSTGPVITFIPPSDDNFAVVGRSYTFINTSIIDLRPVDTCILEFNGANQSATKVGSGTSVICSINKTGLSDGTHTYKMFSNDTLGNIGVSETRNITTGTTAPIITFVSPTDASGAAVSRSFTFVNTTVDSTTAGNIDVCTFSINGTNKAMTKFGSGKNVVCSRNETGLTDGQYTYGVFANDTLNNIGNSGNRTIIIDTVAPSINFILPTPGDNSNQTNNSITINITSVDLTSSIDVCTLEFNGTNQSMTKFGTGLNVTCTAAKTDLIDGTRTYKVFSNDSANNVNVSATRTFTIDTLPPAITIVPPTPGDAIFQSSTTATINSSIVDINTFVNACILDFDGTNQSMNIVGSGKNITCTLTKSSLSNTTHTYVIYANDTVNNLNNTVQRTFTVDTSPPVFLSLTTIPNDAEGLDPNASILVKANVTDSQSGVNSSLIFLESKLTTDSAFVQNIFAFNSSTGFYEVYINKSDAGTYNLRINATDNATNNDVSTLVNITLQFERTWSSTPSQLVFPASAVNQNGSTTITFNNTGDFTQRFNITSNHTLTFFNETAQFNLAPGTIKTLNVTATAGSGTFTSLQLNTTVIDATDLTTPGVPSSIITNGTIIVAPGQPILVATITSTPTTVTIGDTLVSVQAQLENIGQGNASNTSLNISLPTGWTVTAGDKNLNIGDLNTGDVATSTLEITVSSSATTGNQTILAFPTGVNQTGSNLGPLGLLFNDTRIVEVVALQPISGGGGGGGGGGAGGGGAAAAAGGGPTKFEHPTLRKTLIDKEFLETNETVELVRGEDTSFPLKITNVFENTTLSEISLYIKGYLSQYLSHKPETLKNIEYGKTKEFIINIDSPGYFSRGIHNLVFEIKGDAVGKFLVQINDTQEEINTIINFIESRNVTLIIYEIKPELAKELFEKSERNFRNMKQKNFPLKRATMLWEQIQTDYKNLDWNNMQVAAKKLQELHDTSTGADKIITELEAKIKDAQKKGLDVAGTQKIVALAKAAFAREDFETAKRRAEEGRLIEFLEVKGAFNVANFLARYWWAILLSLLFTSATSYVAYRKLVIKVIDQRIKNLINEEINIQELIKELQERCFRKRELSIETYHKIMYRYESRLEKIKTIISRLRTKRIGILTIEDQLKKIKQEEKSLDSIAKNAQESYFVLKNIGKLAYEQRMEEYKLRKSEIEEEIALLETKLGKLLIFEKELNEDFRRNPNFRNKAKRMAHKLSQKIENAVRFLHKL